MKESKLFQPPQGLWSGIDLEFFKNDDKNDSYSILRYSDVEMNDEYIVINKKSKVAKFDPFEYYEKPIPVDIVTQILGQDRPDRSKMFLHTLFFSANMSKKEVVLNWIRNFGLLSKFEVSKETEDVILVNCGNFFLRHYLFRVVFEGFLILNSQDNELKDHIMKELDYFYGTLVGRAVLKNNISLENLLIANLNFLLPAVTPSIFTSVDNKLKLGWNFPSLYKCLWFMLALDVSGSKTIRQCQNPKCGRIFTASRESAIYCSDLCKNRVRQQRHRAKLKEVKE